MTFPRISSLGPGAGIALGSMLGSMFCLMQRRGFDPPLGIFFFFFFGGGGGRGDSFLGVNMGSDSILKKTLSDESINRGLVCAHMHSIAWTPEILTFMS